MDSNETARKIALAGALMAGIAYFGISMLRDVFSTSNKNNNNNNQTKSHKRRKSDSIDYRKTKNNDLSINLSHASSQTDLTLPIGLRHKTSAFRNIPPELWSPWAKSIEERIRELNIRLVNTTNFQFKSGFNYLSPNLKSSYSLGNTPKHSSGIQSPEPLSLISLSAESLNKNSATDLSTNNILLSNQSLIGVKRTLNLSIPSETEIQMHKRILEKLFGKNTPNLSQQDSQSLTVLLMSRDEDLIIKTLSVIANCCAFSVNIVSIVQLIYLSKFDF